MMYRKQVLSFANSSHNEEGVVGRVHRDGSITFRGKTYRTIKEVPPQCLSLRPDVDTHVQWRKLYRAVAPESRRGR